MCKVKENKTIKYIRVWVEEDNNGEGAWYYYLNEFDNSPKRFPFGYVDYYVVVDSNGIIKDTAYFANVGKKFYEMYPRANEVWSHTDCECCGKIIVNNNNISVSEYTVCDSCEATVCMDCVGSFNNCPVCDGELTNKDNF